jgi:hypothetical protein
MPTLTSVRVIGAVTAVLGIAMTAWQWYSVLVGSWWCLGMNLWGTVILVLGLDQLLVLREKGQRRTLVLALAFALGLGNYYLSVVVLKDRLDTESARRASQGEPEQGAAEDRVPTGTPIPSRPMD